MRPIEAGSAADAPELREQLQGRAEPLLLRGLVSHWPAVQAASAAPLAICDYLARFDLGVAVMATKTRAVHCRAVRQGERCHPRLPG